MRSNRTAIVSRISGFLAALLLGGLVGYLFQEQAQFDVAILILATIVYVFVSIVALVILIQEIDKRTQVPDILTQFTTTRQYIFGQPVIYRELQKRILAARYRILVVSLARRSKQDNQAPRTAYYRQIEKCLEDKESRGERFEYHRIVQVGAIEKNHVLQKSHVDDVIFDHCKKMLTPKRRSSSVSVRLQMIDQGSSISFFIIDDNSLILLLPPILRERNPEGIYHIDVGLFIEDNSGDFTKHMDGLFAELTALAQSVNQLED